MLESNRTILNPQAIVLASSDWHTALRLSIPRFSSLDLMMYSGRGVLDLESRVVGVILAAKEVVEIL